MKYDALALQCMKMKSLCKMCIGYSESQWLSHRRCPTSLHTRVKFRATTVTMVVALLKHLDSREPTAPSPWWALTVFKTKETATTKLGFKHWGQILGSASQWSTLATCGIRNQGGRRATGPGVALGSASGFDLGQVASSSAWYFPLWIIITTLALREGIPEFLGLG